MRAVGTGATAAPMSGGVILPYAELCQGPGQLVASLLAGQPLLAQLPYQLRLFLARSPFPAPPEAELPDVCGGSITLLGSMGIPTYLRREGEAVRVVNVRAVPSFGTQREAFSDLAIRWAAGVGRWACFAGRGAAIPAGWLAGWLAWLACWRAWLLLLLLPARLLLLPAAAACCLLLPAAAAGRRSPLAAALAAAAAWLWRPAAGRCAGPCPS